MVVVKLLEYVTKKFTLWLWAYKKASLFKVENIWLFLYSFFFLSVSSWLSQACAPHKATRLSPRRAIPVAGAESLSYPQAVSDISLL